MNSDTHHPSWLNQNVSRYVANVLEIEETIIFEKSYFAAVKKLIF